MSASKFFLALAAIAALATTSVTDPAIAKTITGCDFSDCTSSGVPSIGDGAGTYAAGTGYGSQAASDGVVGTWVGNYSKNMETYVDFGFWNKYGTWDPKPLATYDCTGRINCVTIVGNRQPISSFWTLDPNTNQPTGGGLIMRGTDYGQRQPDVASFGPPYNASKERCIANCDQVQKLDTNWCNTVGGQFGTLTYLVAEGGAIWVGTTTGAAASTTTGPLGPVAGLATWVAARNAFVPVSKDLAAAYVSLCTSFANTRWGDCMKDTCHV